MCGIGRSASPAIAMQNLTMLTKAANGCRYVIGSGKSADAAWRKPAAGIFLNYNSGNLCKTDPVSVRETLGDVTKDAAAPRREMRPSIRLR